MKIWAVSLALVSLSALGDGFVNQSLEEVAQAHLESLRISGQSFELDQETASHVLYLSTFAAGDEEFPCHVGVIVNKISQTVTMGEGDSDLNLQFFYSDTFPDSEKKIYLFCAD